MPELVDVTPGTTQWHDARRAGITATDIPVILGISTYESPYSLYHRKLGNLPPVEDNDRFRLGRDLEPYVAARWRQANDGWTAHGALWRSTERPWQMATLDRLAGRDKSGPDEVLECKSWADADNHSWDDDPPPAVRAQLLWQMDVMNVSRGHVAVVFLPSGEYRDYVVEHSSAGICSLAPDRPNADVGLCMACIDQINMREAGFEFMGRILGDLPAPDLDGSAATLTALRARYLPTPAKQAQVDEDDLGNMADCRNRSKMYAAEARLYESRIREAAGDATELVNADGTILAKRLTVDAKVKAHIRHQDYIRIITTKEDE